MSPNAKRFLVANKESPVVSGAALEPNPNRPSRGARYTLDDGRTFTLSREDCEQVGMPRWCFE